MADETATADESALRLSIVDVCGEPTKKLYLKSTLNFKVLYFLTKEIVHAQPDILQSPNQSPKVPGNPVFRTQS